MSFNCPECKDGELTVDTRNLALEEGEVVQILDDGTPVISKIVCSNDQCSKAATAETSTDEDEGLNGELCSKTDECDRPDGHTGRCNHKGKPAE